jgi:hypothetical protein
MRSFSELAGQDLHWRFEEGSAEVSVAGTRVYVLYDADDQVAQAGVTWQRTVSFDVVLDVGEGTFQVHMDLASLARPSVVWKAGSSESAAGFKVGSEGSLTSNGWITTASGRSLAWVPTNVIGAEYVLFQPGGQALITIAAAPSISIGGNPGHMLIAPDEAADPDLAALATLGFALANEQMLLLHRPWYQPQNRLFGR